VPADEHPHSDASHAAIDLIGQARRGDGVALGDLLQGCRDYLLLIANRELSGDLRRKVSPSDLVQETMADALRDFEAFRGDSSGQLLAWMRQILLNNMAGTVERFRGTAKRDISRETDHTRMEYERAVAMSVDPQPTPSTELLANETREKLVAGLSRLPENYRSVISLRNLELLTYVEIGEQIGCSADAARKLWDRAIRRLSRELESWDEISFGKLRTAPADAGQPNLARGSS